MTDNPWLPIDTMPLSTLGTRVDIRDDGNEHRGITVTRLRTNHCWAGRQAEVAPPWDEFEVTIFDDRRLELALDRTAQWRPHV